MALVRGLVLVRGLFYRRLHLVHTSPANFGRLIGHRNVNPGSTTLAANRSVAKVPAEWRRKRTS